VVNSKKNGELLEKKMKKGDNGFFSTKKDSEAQ
jgi:hypothetical protein